ncbi:DUF2971 domain-containing protein [Oricola thermophila]|uniref:DUF2971 domain-containing protein n=1 Tax=Oricola thermophila TaxID=2742145 RepID=A0A6N1VGW3_9HYPH|nr:DUF2971 domain-containing protein [Oricola thermophila]QKV20054.1 DUF2971 domain-containing protein [Oricola thermophila]
MQTEASAKLLYKFSGPTEYALQNLENGVIFCQHYSAYNDPFEFWSRICEGIPDPKVEPERYLAAAEAWGFPSDSVDELLADEIFAENAEEYFDECKDYAPPFFEMRQGIRIACFGSEQDNLLMWSHYGGGLRGFCIVFDEELIANADPEGYLFDVAYLKKPPIVDSLVYGIAWDQDWFCQTAMDEAARASESHGRTELPPGAEDYKEAGAEAVKTMHEIWRNAFGAKPVEWSYERERRLLVQTNRTDDLPILRKYPPKAIKMIVVGERMPHDYRCRLEEVLSNRYTHAPILTAKRSSSHYQLDIV